MPKFFAANNANAFNRSTLFVGSFAAFCRAIAIVANVKSLVFSPANFTDKRFLCACGNGFAF